jgi:predicted 3-demethylubiquinone-9 3-methyltransferase (glyoxalase superfamily)
VRERLIKLNLLEMKSNNIYPCLWFDGKAKEAADFYCSVFNNSVITYENQMVVIFESSGQKFMCLNGGPEFTFNPSVSFYVSCETEEEISRLWKNLIEGGSELMPLDKYDWSKKYVWLQDKFGVNWQLSFGGMEKTGHKFSPVLMFTEKQAGKAEEAIHFYTSVFEGSDITGILKYIKDDNDIEGTVKHAEFTLGRHVFMAMDSSFMHQFSFNEAISFVVDCETQEEIDYFWDKLTEGGEEVQCGWLKDKFGVSWQIVPAILFKLLSDPSRSERVTQAFLQMKKFDLEKLIKA